MRATTLGIWKVSRAMRAVRMLELSPLVTAARAPASADAGRGPGRRGRSRSRRRSVPGHSSGRRRKALAFLSMMATVWPCPLSPIAEPGADPAAPHDDDVHPTMQHARQAITTQGAVPRSVDAGTCPASRQGAVGPYGKALIREGVDLRPEPSSRRGRPRPAVRPTPRCRPSGVAPRFRPVATPARELRYRLKNRLLGPPLATDRQAHERLGKPTALAVFSSDCISSSAYATEQILTRLVPVVGVAAFSLVVPDHHRPAGRAGLPDPLLPRDDQGVPQRPAAPTWSPATTSACSRPRSPASPC